MAYTTPHTIIAGETVTIATMNNEWGGNAAFLANPPACRVYNNAAITIATGTPTVLTFNSERHDTDTMHSTSTNTGRITIKTAGLFEMKGQVRFGTNGVGERYASLRVNGATEIAYVSIAGAGIALDVGMIVSTTYKFAVNDYVELVVYQSSGGNLNVVNAGNSSPEFSATWIGRG